MRQLTVAQFLFILLSISWASKIRSVDFGRMRSRIVGSSAVVALTLATFGTSHATDQTTSSSLEIQKGMESFRKCDISGSIYHFDEAVKKDSSVEPYMWQRGLSLYYDNDFDGCYQQFKRDVDVNKNDVEEVVWALLCDARRDNFNSAQSRMLPLQRKDSRSVMQVVLNVGRGVQSEKELEEFGTGSGIGSPEYFYSRLYLALFAEVKGDAFAAQNRIEEALASPYGANSRDYMAALARCHNVLRSENKPEL